MGLLSWLSGRRAADAPASSSPAGPVGGWREVPPLQRTLGDAALVIDPDGFRGSLSTWRNASFTTAPLGHEVSPQAPSGVGHGLASRAAAAPVSGASAPASTVSREAAPSAPPVPLQRVVGGEPLMSARPLETCVHQLEPVLPAPDPSPATVPEPGPEPVPGAPAPPSPPPSVQRSTVPHGLGLGAPLAALPPTAQRTPAASTAEPPAALPALPGPAEAEAVSPDAPIEAPMEVLAAAPEAPAAPEPAIPARPLLGDSPLAVAPTGGPAAPGAHPPVPLQRIAADGRPAGPSTGPGRLSSGPVTPTVPLVAQRSLPLFSGPAPLPTGPAAPTPGPPAPAVVPVRWSGPAPATSPPPVQRTTTTPTPAPTPVAPWTAAPVPPPAPPVVDLLAAPVQRLTDPPATPPSPEPAGQPARMLDAGAVAVAAGVAQRMADGSVVFRASRSLPAVQREAAAPGPAPTEPPPPGPGPPSEPPPPAPDPGPGPDPAPPGTTGHPEAKGTAQGTAQGTAPAVTDELVRALFAPLSRLLKAELRLERERAGFLIDTRH
ncbi:hypothetical protein ACQEVX_32795 [Streptomyces syringium]|uniref:hypothetical protein n=1 Tax=Streptomyces syringium TaxID=76729 RepID=UPI003D8A6E4B